MSANPVIDLSPVTVARFTFGASSLAQLKTCAPQLQLLFHEVIKSYNCKVVEGHRGKEAQNYAFDHGFSKLRYPNGNHNATPSKAADVYPFPIAAKMDSPAYIKRMVHFAGFVKATAIAMNIPIICGIDWDDDNDFTDQSFHDLPHFELRR